MNVTQYAHAGVDIELGNRVKAELPKLLASTHRSEVLGKVGGFGGLFALNCRKYRKPVLVSSVDGVGTKLKVAFLADKHDTNTKDDCKNGGWQSYGFKNQGQCVSSLRPSAR